MKRVAFLFSVVLVLSVGCGRRPPEGFFIPLEPSLTKLDNGLEVMVLEDPEFPTLQMQVYIRGGAVFDPRGQEGLAAVSMQTVRLGGAEAPGREPQKIEEDLEFVGASLEMGAGAEFLSASLGLMTKDTDLGLDILFDLLRRPTLDPARLGLVKERMKDAILREEEDPLRLAYREFPGLIYGPESPWGRKTTVESVGRIVREDVQKFCREGLVPDRVLIAVAGNVPQKEIVEKIRARTAGWEKSRTALPEIPPVKEAYQKGGFVASRKDLTQSTVILGHLGARRDNPDKFALIVMNFVLGGSGSLTSRLGEEIRSTAGKAYGIWSDFGFGKDLGIFRTVAQTALENTAWVARKMEEMVALLQRGTDGGRVTAEETGKARQAILRSLVFDFETRFAQVKEQTRFRLQGYPDDYLLRFQRGIAAVTPEDVARVAQKYLHSEGLKLLIVTDQNEAKKLQLEMDLRSIP